MSTPTDQAKAVEKAAFFALLESLDLDTPTINSFLNKRGNEVKPASVILNYRRPQRIPKKTMMPKLQQSSRVLAGGITMPNLLTPTWAKSAVW